MQLIKNTKNWLSKHLFTISYVIILSAFMGVVYKLAHTQSELAKAEIQNINLMQDNMKLMEGSKEKLEAVNAFISLTTAQRSVINKLKELNEEQKEVIQFLINKIEEMKWNTPSRPSRSIAGTN